MAVLDPVTLTGERVTLEPLSHDHAEGLAAAARDGELWRLWYTSVPAPEGMRDEIDRRLALHAAGTMLPFTVHRKDTAAVVGMTTFLNVDAATRRVEIGSTWMARSAQRTGLNAEAKLLLLTHAFDVLQCVAVEFRTHWPTCSRARRSTGSAPSRTASCATTSGCRTAHCATPSCSRSCSQSGPPCEVVCCTG
jgi:RimJ/RimL family protein N-acetyltransferase